MTRQEMSEFLEILEDMFHDKFKFYRSYQATVMIPLDLMMKGRVGLMCTSLNALLPTDYIFATPVSGAGQKMTPRVGDMGMLMFLEGNPNNAVFIGFPSIEMTLPLPLQTMHTVAQTPNVMSNITVDELVGGFILWSKSPVGLLAPVPEPTVLGLKFLELVTYEFTFYNYALTELTTIYTELASIYAEIGSIYTELGTHLHPTAAPGAPTLPALPPTPASVAKGTAAVSKGTASTTKGVSAISAKMAELTAKLATLPIPGAILSPSNKMN